MLKNTVLAIYLSILTNFSIYQLTNLYSRAALTEFFAYQLILLGFSLSYFALLHKRKTSNAFLALGFASFTFVMGAHPITFYTFCIFVFPLVIIFIVNFHSWFDNFSILKIFLYIFGAGAILVPWIINALMFRKELKLSNARLYYFPQSIDSLWAKIGFLYIDQRVIENGVFSTPTPFLDAPLPLILFVLVGFILYYARQSIKINYFKFIVPLCIIIFVLMAGIIPPKTGFAGPWVGTIYVSNQQSMLHQILMPIQFVYRLSGAVSLSMVVMSVFSIHFFSKTNAHQSFHKNLTTIVYVMSLLALMACVKKTAEIYIEYIKAPELIAATSPVIEDHYIDARVLLITSAEYRSITKNTSRYPFTFYGPRAYTMPQLYQFRPETDVPDRQIIPLLVRDYAQDIHVTCDRDCLLQTNIVPTTLHRITIDGREPEKAFLAKTENLDFDLPAGNHVIRVDLVGDFVQPIIMSIWLALGLLCLVVLYAAFMIGVEIKARCNRAVL